MEHHEVVIVGAGPGGATAAKLLAEKGKDVLVIEREKEKKIGIKCCAGALSPKIYSQQPEKLFERYIYGVNVNFPSGKVVEINASKPIMAMISRHELGQHLLNSATNAGAELMDDSRVTKVNRTDKEVIVNGKSIKYDILIGADGTNSIVRRSLGLKNRDSLWCQWTVDNPDNKDKVEVYFDFSLCGLGTIYAFPHDDYIAVGGGGPMPLKPISELRDNIAKFLRKGGYDLDKAEFGGAGINYNYQGHRFGNLYLVGDAGGFSNLVTGEGIAQAIISAEMVVCEILNKNKKEEGKKLLESMKRDQQLLTFHDLTLGWMSNREFIYNFLNFGSRFLPYFLLLEKNRIIDGWLKGL
jgi:geranylgeranyl reductase family